MTLQAMAHPTLPAVSFAGRAAEDPAQLLPIA